MQITPNRQDRRITEAKNLHAFLAAEYNRLSLATALGESVDPERYTQIDRELRRVEMIVDLNSQRLPMRG